MKFIVSETKIIFSFSLKFGNGFPGKEEKGLWVEDRGSGIDCHKEGCCIFCDMKTTLFLLLNITGISIIYS